MKRVIFARRLLAADGWRTDCHVAIGGDGRIEAVGAGDLQGSRKVGVLLPAVGNLHSHSFQRAAAGLAETRGPDSFDDFWSWRSLMYGFLERLAPEDVEAIAAFAQMEMLEAGFAAVGEFHYIHHQADGSHFDDPAELSNRHLAAAVESGIGYTHLPVLYMRGGTDDRPLEGGQRRFGCDLAVFGRLFESIGAAMRKCPADFRLGAAPHSLRAVTKAGVRFAADLAPAAPLHIHVAEQTREVEDVLAAYGARPVRWLLDNFSVDDRWCFVHATHLARDEIEGLAASSAVAGLCPVTEANLGDGIFEAGAYAAAGGRMGVGTDSNVRISLAEELRTLEYSQRLRDRRRVILADPRKGGSCGRFLFEEAARSGAQALGRNAGRIEPGALADLVALDADSSHLAGLEGDRIIDAWIFAGDNRLVSDVWAAGRHVVKDGAHVRRDALARRFNAIMARLRTTI